MILGYLLTVHAKRRMDSRRINLEALEATLWFGRKIHIRGAVVYAIGKREARKWVECGIDLSQYEGLQAVCSLDRHVITVYRSHDFRSLRPRYHRRDRRRWFPGVTLQDADAICCSLLRPSTIDESASGLATKTSSPVTVGTQARRQSKVSSSGDTVRVT